MFLLTIDPAFVPHKSWFSERKAGWKLRSRCEGSSSPQVRPEELIAGGLSENSVRP